FVEDPRRCTPSDHCVGRESAGRILVLLPRGTLHAYAHGRCANCTNHSGAASTCEGRLAYRNVCCAARTLLTRTRESMNNMLQNAHKLPLMESRLQQWTGLDEQDTAFLLDLFRQLEKQQAVKSSSWNVEQH